MKLYISHIIKLLLWPTLAITLSLTCLVWLTQALRFIDLIINRSLPLSTYLYLVGLLLPSLLGLVMPIALFCATIYTYNRLIMESELVVLKSAGLSRLQLAIPGIIFAGGIMAIGYAISLYLLPVSYKEFKNLQTFVRDNYASLLLQEGIFNTPVEGLTVYVRERSKGEKLLGILVHDSRNIEKPVTMMAQSGQLVNTSTGPQFLLDHGNRQELDKRTGAISLLNFDNYNLDIGFYTRRSMERQIEKEELFLPDLFNPPADMREYTRKKFIVEGHQRILWPVYSLALALLVMGTLISSDHNRRGHTQTLIVTIAIAAVSMLISVGLRNVAAKEGVWAIALMYVNVIGLMCISVAMLKSSRKLSFDFTPLIDKVMRR